MNVMNLLIYFSIFLGLDLIYLSTASNHFNQVVSKIQGSPLKLDFIAAFLTYISMLFGLYYFVLREKKSLIHASIFGFIVYSVFDLTNKSIFKKWDWFTVILDSVWGSILFTTVTYLVYKFNLIT